MNKVSNSVLRSSLALVLGLVLVVWPELAVTYLVITIGILFIIPGIFAILNYFTRSRKEPGTSSSFPLEGAGSILFGIWLVVMPAFFVNILMYVLGALLILGGIQQFISLISIRKWRLIPWYYYVVPVLILIAGIIIVAYPFSTVTITFIIFGIACIIYGISELINSYTFRKAIPSEK